uniref:Uncharacterized protein n=1 Tax=Rangifer tarandus platyrhynchus TaxID=3082113 RepID=A0ACB0FEE2_RANTA|nr:unnamed protein product [Rangifer tarandus platyrhynchus]
MLCSVPCRKALPHPHSTEKTGTREAQRGLPGSTPPQHYLWQRHGDQPGHAGTREQTLPGSPLSHFLTEGTGRSQRPAVTRRPSGPGASGRGGQRRYLSPGTFQEGLVEAREEDATLSGDLGSQQPSPGTPQGGSQPISRSGRLLREEMISWAQIGTHEHPRHTRHPAAPRPVTDAAADRMPTMCQEDKPNTWFSGKRVHCCRTPDAWTLPLQQQEGGT